jgi:hypothetical protein
MGAPVLYGFPNGSSFINELLTGMTVPVSTSTNVCPTSVSEIVDTVTSFGYDSITGCSMNFNRQQLIDFCCTGAPGTCLDNSVIQTIQSSPFIDKSNGHPFFLNFTDGYVITSIFLFESSSLILLIFCSFSLSLLFCSL